MTVQHGSCIIESSIGRDLWRAIKRLAHVSANPVVFAESNDSCLLAKLNYSIRITISSVLSMKNKSFSRKMSANNFKHSFKIKMHRLFRFWRFILYFIPSKVRLVLKRTVGYFSGILAGKLFLSFRMF